MKKSLAVCLLVVFAGFILYSVVGIVNTAVLPLVSGNSATQADNIPVPRHLTLSGSLGLQG